MTMGVESICHSHTDTVLRGLNELRGQELLVDITLLADDRAFKAHRVVLASCSDYFRAMFTAGMSESRKSEICLTGVTARGVELLLNYAYTSKLDLNLTNVQDVLSAANYVQMEPVVVACTDYLQTQLDNDNCIDLLNISDTYALPKLRLECYRFICGHLRELSSIGEVCRLDWHQLEHILSCDFLVDCPEQVVIRIVLQWIELMNSDITITERLLHHIRLSDIPRAALQRLFDDIPALTSKLSQTAAITRQLRQEIKSILKLPPNQNSSLLTNTNALINLRGLEVAMVNVGGFRVAGITNEITYFLPSMGKWQHLTTIPHVEQCNYGTAVLDNELYVVGGCFNVSLNEQIHPYVFRFNPIADKWTSLERMHKERCRFSLNIVNGWLYAVGGVIAELDAVDDELFDLPERPESNCERYDPVSNRWECIPTIPEDRSQHAGASYDGCLYISGGIDTLFVLASFWQFDVSTSEWQRLADMPTARADHVMLAVNDKLIVCGGWCEELSTEDRRLVDTIHVYDPAERIWSVMTNIPTPKYHSGIVAVDSCIYIIGGFHSESMLDRASSTIDCYDIAKNVWTVMDRYPQKIWECSCVTLYINKFRNDTDVIVDETVVVTTPAASVMPAMFVLEQ